MTLAPGSYLLVLYDVPGPEMWHERLVIGGDGWYCVETPSGDIFMEQVSTSNEDLAGLRLLREAGGNAVGVARNSFFRFRQARTAEELRDLEAQGEFIASQYGHGRRQAAPEVRPPPGAAGSSQPSAPALPLATEAPGQWAIASAGGRLEFGSLAPREPDESKRIGARGLLEIGGEVYWVERVATNLGIDAFKDQTLDTWAAEVSDIRVMNVKFESGRRHRAFAEAVDLLEQDNGLKEFPQGPRTVLEEMQRLRRQGLTPQTATQAWVDAASIPKGDRSVYEYDTLGEILYALLCVDQMNIANSVGAEIACRRRSVIVEAHALSPSNPDYSAAEDIMGFGGRKGASGILPALANYTAACLRDKAAIHKEKRKAAEEMRIKRSGNGGGGGSKS